MDIICHSRSQSIKLKHFGQFANRKFAYLAKKQILKVIRYWLFFYFFSNKHFSSSRDQQNSCHRSLTWLIIVLRAETFCLCMSKTFVFFFYKTSLSSHCLFTTYLLLFLHVILYSWHSLQDIWQMYFFYTASEHYKGLVALSLLCIMGCYVVSDIFGMPVFSY